MHVLVNAHLLSSAESFRGAGVSNYSRRLLTHLGRLAQAQDDLRISAALHVVDTRLPGVEGVLSRLPLDRPELRIVWEQTVLPGLAHRLGADLLHGLVNVLPLAGSTPSVVTVHDLSFLRMPEKFPRLKRAYLAALCAASVRRARRVIAVSRQTADDVMRYLDAPAEKIAVIYNGVGEEFISGTEAQAAAFRRERNLPGRFFLYVGTLEPRKNLETLLSAYGAWKRRSGAEVALVLAGGKGWLYETIFRRVEELGLAGEVLFPGFVPGAELPDWYRAAEAFVYPSLFEGFGLPILEAMACGTPVLCSRASSLLEVAGDAALTFAATDEAELADGLARLAEDGPLREELRRRGLARAVQFSWQQAASETLAVYRDAVGERPEAPARSRIV